MKFLVRFFAIALFLAVLFISKTTIVRANVEVSLDPTSVNENTPAVKINFSNLVPGKDYFICRTDDPHICVDSPLKFKPDSDGNYTLNSCGDGDNRLKFPSSCSDRDYFFGGKTYSAYLYDELKSTSNTLAKAQFAVAYFVPEILTVTPPHPKPNDELTITIKGSRRPPQDNDKYNERNTYDFDLSGKGTDGTSVSTNDPSNLTVPQGGQNERKFTLSQEGKYTLTVKLSLPDHTVIVIPITIDKNGGTVNNSGSNNGVSTEPGVNLCAQNPGEVATKCKTALGDIPVEPKALTQRILSISLGLAGGIALIFMVYGSIRILVSSGDPKKVGEGRDIIVAAIAGLLFIILSVLILKFIGVSVLPNSPFE